MSDTSQVQHLTVGQRIVLYGQVVTFLRFETVPGLILGYLWFRTHPNGAPRRVSRRPDATVRLAKAR